MRYRHRNFQDRILHGPLVMTHLKRKCDEWTNKAKGIYPINYAEVGGIITKKKKVKK